jgi:ABC-type branched-subunit amino acid transport system ATPase component
MAGLAPNTVSNYLRGADPAHSASGKARSAKLEEVEMLARALAVSPQLLLLDTDAKEQLVGRIAAEVLATMQNAGTQPSSPRKQPPLAA